MKNRSVLPLEAIHQLVKDRLSVEVVLERGKIGGRVVGLDEYMNVVVDQEGSRMVVKGECIFAIISADF